MTLPHTPCTFVEFPYKKPDEKESMCIQCMYTQMGR